MAEVLRFPSLFSSSQRRELYCDPVDGSSSGEEEAEGRGGGGGVVEGKDERRRRSGGGEQEEEEEQGQLSVLALLLTVLRKSLIGCKAVAVSDEAMEIGWPTDVRHVAHVTFDRFHGFLGLPVEFEPEVPRRAPSASATIFGVSAKSMQCSYDSRSNSVPTILLLMQQRLYEQGGLRAEGIFRINGENGQEEYVRHLLNNGIVPEGVDVHCLAGLVKAWFRELPTGLLDSLSPEQVMQCQTEEDCARLAALLPPTEAALLDWSINLMADVVQQEDANKMNARNIATVFAPNMTQMADPLTALMHAVQVMNFLRMLILKTVKERQDSLLEEVSISNDDPSDENGHRSPELDNTIQVAEEKLSGNEAFHFPQNSHENPAPEKEGIPARSSNDHELATNGPNFAAHANPPRKKWRSLSGKNHRKGRTKERSRTRASMQDEKSQGTSNLSRINSKVERVEAI
ncbi:rho GTPase-activating protein 5-like [Curcuma longa]|uniref:rho GTPase-activating protein 5-like n=1 Tax=Curcuma longa TaxID=136217 RepID=UPI003D9E1E99